MYGKIPSSFIPWSVGEYERHKAIKRIPLGSREPFFKYDMNYDNIKKNNAIVKRNTVSDDSEQVDTANIIGSAIVFIVIAIILM